MQVGGQAALGVGAAFTAAVAIVSQLRTGNDDPGVTTEVALVVAFMLGALAQSETELAVGSGVVVAILLASRSRLHTLVKTALTEQELHDGLLLAAAAVVVLPILPDQPFGPGGAVNPFTVWRLVVIVMLISAAGYVALRTLGPRVGLPLTGFASGFVSSSVSSVLRDRLGNAGVSVTAGVAGFADTHAASASVASLVATGHLQPRDAVLPIMLALTANTVTKVTVATVAGGRGRFAVIVGAGLRGVIAAAWVGAAIALVASPPW